MAEKTVTELHVSARKGELANSQSRKICKFAKTPNFSIFPAKIGDFTKLCNFKARKLARQMR
ncbi:hypothetical protein J7412_05025 [Shimia sp. R9_3]|nr:hypothetical protein [Shimia sp. R9_3]